MDLALDEETDEGSIRITEPSSEIDPKSITATSPKKYVKIALQGDVEIKCSTSATVQTRLPFKSGKRAGDAQPDLEVAHTWIQGRIPKLASFTVHFANNSFKDAIVWDAVGWPTELWADYSEPAPKQAKGEPAAAWQNRCDQLEMEVMGRNYDYNDGKTWVNRAPRAVKAAGQFDDWLADLIPSFATQREEAAVKSAAAKAKKAAKLATKNEQQLTSEGAK